jgi:hypothetical protein
MEYLVIVIRQEKEIKEQNIEKKEKLPLCLDDLITYIENV